MKKTFVSLLAGGLLLASMSASQAVNTTFAQFTQKNSDKPFVYTSGGLFGSGTLKATDVPVRFTVLDALDGFKTGISTTVPPPSTVYDALLTVTAHTSSLGSFNQADTLLDDLTFTFTKVGASDGLANGAILLSGTTLGGNLHAPKNVNGGTLDASSTLNADAPDFVSFSSDLWKFSSPTGQNLGWGISAADKKFAYDGTLPFFLQSNKWDMSGTFGIDFSGTVPEPGVVSLLAGMALCGGTFSLRLRRRRK